MSYVKVLNKTNLTLEIKLSYIKNNESKTTTIESPPFKKGEYQWLSIPTGAKNILCEIYYEADKGIWGALTNSKISTKTTKCFEISGTEKKPSMKEVQCKNSIYFTNKTQVSIKGQIIYFIEGDKLGHKLESASIAFGRSLTLNLPLNATTIQFSILTQSGSQWQRNSNVINLPSTPVNKCYTVSGSSTKILITETKCAPSLTSTPPINEFIKFLNLTTQKIKATLSYNNGTTIINMSTDIININQLVLINVSPLATDISLSIHYLDHNSNWAKLHKVLSDFKHPIRICYKITEINGIFSFLPVNCNKLTP